MTIVKTGKCVVYVVATDQTETFDSVQEGKAYAVTLVGNSFPAQPFPDEQTFLYGPGDGTTSVVVREEVYFVPLARAAGE